MGDEYSFPESNTKSKEITEDDDQIEAKDSVLSDAARDSFLVSWLNPEGEEEEGPLLLLWNLIESYRVDIFDVSLNKITIDFLAFMQRSRELNIEHVSSFTLMAARLLYYKSKALLPNPGFEEQDAEPRLPPEIIQQLLEYRKFQMATEKIQEMGERAAGMLSRKSKTRFKQKEGEDEWLNVSLVELVRAYGKIIEKHTKESDEDEKRYEIELEASSVEEKIENIKMFLENAVSFDFTDLFSDLHNMNKWDIVSTFLAILELCKNGEIVLQQKKIFGPIIIFKKSIAVR